MRFKSSVTAFALCWFLKSSVGCAVDHRSLPEGTKFNLDYIKTADPICDADATLNSQKKILIGVVGLGEYIPGAEDYPELIASSRIVYIEGTSDTIDVASMKAADEYAELFNRVVIWRRRH